MTNKDMRVGDLSRQRVANLLSEHYAAGRLNADEFESRLTATWETTTREELGAVVSDLPHITRRVARRRWERSALRVHAAAYLAVMLLLVAIWIMAGAGYPWPIWPAMGWGIALLAQASATRSRSRPGAPSVLS